VTYAQRYIVLLQTIRAVPWPWPAGTAGLFLWLSQWPRHLRRNPSAKRGAVWYSTCNIWNTCGSV